MERVREAVQVAEFRATLVSVVQELVELRVAKSAYESRSLSTDFNEEESEKKFESSATFSNDEVKKLRLERVRDAEEISTFKKQVEGLHSEIDRYVQENKKILRENAEHEKHIQEMGEEISKENAAKEAMSSLMETLRTNQDELSESLSRVLDEKQQLSLAIKRAEESSVTVLRSLQEKNRMIENLQKEIARFEKKGSEQSERIEEILAENSTLKVLTLNQEKQLSKAQSESIITQGEVDSLSKSLESNMKITKDLQDEIKLSDERCTALMQSNKQVFEDFEDARVKFQEQRITMREELSRAQLEMTEATNAEQELKTKLKVETSNRKIVETERDELKAALEASEEAKVEAEKCAKQKTDEFRILSTKHDRLLQAQRAVNMQQKQQQQQQQRMNNQSRDSNQKQSNRSFQTSSFQLSGGATNSIVPVQKKSTSHQNNQDNGHLPQDDQNNADDFDFYMNNDDSTDPSSSDPPPRIVAQKCSMISSPRKAVQELCPLCSDVPYGLMARCQSCKLSFHSLCLPSNKRTLGSKFVCTSCDDKAK